MEAILKHRILNLLIITLFMAGIHLLISVAHAQSIQSEFRTDKKAEADKEKEKLKLSAQPFSLDKMGMLEPAIQALEQAVNPDEYLVGPGDLFYVNITGESYLSSAILVTPEGKMIIPSIGTFDVRNKTLTDVKTMVLEHGKNKYKLNNIVEANLVQMRNFRVHVLGEVETPATYMAQPIDRVSVMIERANGITDWADERNISIRHLDGSYDTCDLFEFYHKGNLTSNIYVRSGDVIYVPPINLSRKTVTIDGIMDKSGIYQIIDGETIEDFLLRVDALNKKVEVSDIYLLRNGAEGKKNVVKINLFDGHGNLPSNANLTLEDGDIIFAPSIRDYVYVAGAVQQPGSYPFFVGFRAIDYVGIAGGIIEMGRMKGIKTFREKNQTFENGANVIIDRGDTIFVPTTARRKIIEYISIISSVTTIGLFFIAVQK
jgi:protein involved in polysaccharide export with SLBB domain